MGFSSQLNINMGDSYVAVRVIDAQGHLMGRLAATVAKNLLQGQKIVVVRCEGILISGNFYRNKLKYLDFLKKGTRTNPKKGPLHFRAPSKMFWRVVRGMLPHKLKRGAAAMDRLKVFEGIPPPYDKKKRFVLASCMKVVKLSHTVVSLNFPDLPTKLAGRTRLSSRPSKRSAKPSQLNTSRRSKRNWLSARRLLSTYKTKSKNLMTKFLLWDTKFVNLSSNNKLDDLY